jgi:VIT1/CCC1 family predicted Fe2+/Mn2+ transporter
MTQQFIISAILAGIMFFLIGMLKSIALKKPALKSGIRTLLTGEQLQDWLISQRIFTRSF